MVAFIDAQRDAYGVEPMCAVLPIAPATYFRHKRCQADPDKAAPGGDVGEIRALKLTFLG